MTPILEVDNLTKRYGELTAVDGVSFQVEVGEVFGLLGPNGAGKTTLISMLTGVLPPTAGTARIGGHDIRTAMDRAKQINGLVPQDVALYSTLSARANITFFGQIYGLRGQALRDRVDDVLRIVGLTERADDRVETFSGGMRRRVNIAAGLVHQPRLLFLDEPTVGVDPQSRNHIFESVTQLNRERGMSIIYTSHYMEEVEMLCSRAAIIDQGRIIALDSVKNLVALLGGGVIHVGISHADEALLAQIAALPIVQEALPLNVPRDDEDTEPRTDGAVIKIVVEPGQDALVSIIGLLNAEGVTITSLEILKPNLESVFLHLTGKKLRD